MTSLTLKSARALLRFERALPLLKPARRAQVARRAREIVAGGWSIPNISKQLDTKHPVSYARVGKALAELAVADLKVLA